MGDGGSARPHAPQGKDMNHRPVLIDVRTVVYEDDMAKEVTVAEQVDISGILLELLGDDGDMAVSFAEDPCQAEWPLFYEMLAAHPKVSCSEPQIDGHFDLATAIDPTISRRSSDEDIGSAWTAWRTAALDAGSIQSYADTRWKSHAEDLEAWLAQAMPSRAVLLEFAAVLLANREMTAAILAAAASPRGPTVEALRTCVALTDTLPDAA